jgi:hypothetical protein
LRVPGNENSHGFVARGCELCRHLSDLLCQPRAKAVTMVNQQEGYVTLLETAIGTPQKEECAHVGKVLPLGKPIHSLALWPRRECLRSLALLLVK